VVVRDFLFITTTAAPRSAAQPKAISHALCTIILNRKGEWHMRYCPECGGELKYMSATKRYVCKSCGLSVTVQELFELRRQLRPSFESEEDQRRRERKEYLKWWLGKKK